MIGSANTLIDKKGGYIQPSKTTEFVWEKMSIPLPYNFYNGVAVVNNNYEIHILGSQGTGRMHYKWNGTSWVSVSSLPYWVNFADASVYDDRLYLVGGSGNAKNLYVYDISDTSTYVKTWGAGVSLPVNFYDGAVLTYDNKLHILGGVNPKIHYSLDENDGVKAAWASRSTLPYSFTKGSAVVFNEEIHILGSSVEGEGQKHYKWSGSTWISVSTLPYNFYAGKAVVYEDKIHIIGGQDANNQRSHYTWDGTKWEKVPTDLPYDFYGGGAVRADYKLWLLGGAKESSHYLNFYRGEVKDIYDMTLPQNSEVMAFEPSVDSTKVTVTDYGFKADKNEYSNIQFSVSTNTPITVTNNKSILYANNGIIKEKLNITPDIYYPANVALYHDEVHAVATYYHYKYNFKSKKWIRLGNLPYEFKDSTIIVYNDEIHIMGTSVYQADATVHYKWDETTDTWSSVSILPYAYCMGRALIIDGKLHLFGNKYTAAGASTTRYHYYWDGTTWTRDRDLPITVTRSGVVMYNGELHLIGGQYSARLHYKWNGTSWVNVTTLPYAIDTVTNAIVYKGKIHVFGGWGYDDVTWHGVWDGTKWTQMTNIPISMEYVYDIFIYEDKIYFMSTDRFQPIFYTYDGTNWDNRVMKNGCYAFKNMKINGEIIYVNESVIIDEGSPITLEY